MIKLWRGDKLNYKRNNSDVIMKLNIVYTHICVVERVKSESGFLSSAREAGKRRGDDVEKPTKEHTQGHTPQWSDGRKGRNTSETLSPTSAPIVLRCHH